MASVATGVNRGRNIVGLNPDDRYPQDWLRMVARVFAAYRLTPLETSVVAYIDGFHLSLESYIYPEAIVGITGGQAFVDDQFIGYNDTDDSVDPTPESSITVNVDSMVVDVVYSIVLCYTYVNIMPPYKSNFDVVEQSNIDPEHMLELGQLIRHSNDDLELIDDKRPWYWEMLLQFIGDTEIDGLASNRLNSKVLPYLIAVKEDETIDIGWALDFHCEAGKDADNDANGNPINHHDSDVRLSVKSPLDYNDPLNPPPLPGAQLCNADNLYIDDRPILTAPTEGNGYDDIHDPGAPDCISNLGAEDKVGIYPANLRLVDSNTTAASNSGYINLELNTLDTMSNVGAVLSHFRDLNETHLKNFSDFADAASCINDFRLGNQPFDVTINNKQILTYNDFPGGVPPELIFFIGKFNSEPVERFPNDSRYEQVQDGDMYYNLPEHTYYFYEKDRWSILGSNAPIRGAHHSYTAVSGQVNFPTATSDDFIADPDFLMVSRAGLILTPDGATPGSGDYRLVYNTGTNAGTYVIQVIMNQSCERDERVNIYTANVGPGQLPDLTITTTNFINGSVIATQGQTTFNYAHNKDFSLISINGFLQVEGVDYTLDGTNIAFTNPLNSGDIFQLISVIEDEGKLGLIDETFTAVGTGTETFNVNHNPGFTLVFANGVRLPHSRYDASSSSSININGLGADDKIRVWSVIDVIGTKFTFWDQEEVVSGLGSDTKTVFNFDYDPAFSIVTVDGNLLRDSIEYTFENGNLNLTDGVVDDQVVVLSSILKNSTYNTGTAVFSSPASRQKVRYESKEFTGDGVQTVFVTDALFEEAPVSVNGARIRPTDYNVQMVGNTTIITFNSPPEDNAWIIVDYVG